MAVGDVVAEPAERSDRRHRCCRGAGSAPRLSATAGGGRCWPASPRRTSRTTSATACSIRCCRSSATPSALYAQSGFLVSAFSLSLGLSNAPIGVLADRVGPRPVIVAGLVLTGAISAALAFAGEYWQLVLLLIVMGLIAGTYHAPAAALIARAFPANVARRGDGLAHHRRAPQLLRHAAGCRLAGRRDRDLDARRTSGWRSRRS